MMRFHSNRERRVQSALRLAGEVEGFLFRFAFLFAGAPPFHFPDFFLEKGVQCR